jgi:hypothetical protein
MVYLLVAVEGVVGWFVLMFVGAQLVGIVVSGLAQRMPTPEGGP